ncbi:hypothetical protein [Solicola sp. PLA-1-18]|uniref:hypothetical protein n=1 Tax=Solicola sp. PLA-1-18 TaxID=3380532 RepID=UPI003B7991C4
MSETIDGPLLRARALVLHDLQARGLADAPGVSAMEESLSERTWWLEQWPDGAAFVPGLVAQDVQDSMLDGRGRWPLCHGCDVEHALALEPPLGEEPHWVCEPTATVVAPLGSL